MNLWWPNICFSANQINQLQKTPIGNFSALTWCPCKALNLFSSHYRALQKSKARTKIYKKLILIIKPQNMKCMITQIACLFLVEIIYLASAQCRKCDQTITGRNFMYSRALDIIQNEEYLDQSDFDEIRYKQKLRSVL